MTYVFGLRDTPEFKAEREQITTDLLNARQYNLAIKSLDYQYFNEGFGESTLSFSLNNAGDKLVGTDTRTGDIIRFDAKTQRATSHELNERHWSDACSMAVALENYKGDVRDADSIEAIKHEGKTYVYDHKPNYKTDLVCLSEGKEIARANAAIVSEVRDLVKTDAARSAFEDKSNKPEKMSVIDGLRTKEAGYVWTDKATGNKWELDGENVKVTKPDGMVFAANADLINAGWHAKREKQQAQEHKTALREVTSHYKTERATNAANRASAPAKEPEQAMSR